MDIRNYFKRLNVLEERHKAVQTNILDEDCWIEQGHINNIEYDFDTLWCIHPEEFGSVKYGSKVISTPRWQKCYCRPYYFSGMTHDALPLPNEFQPFLEWANSLLYPDWKFNQVLVNWYGDGHHYISKHADAEYQIVPKSPIVSISLGQERTFRIRNKSDDAIVLDLPMPDKTYVSMCGAMQERFLHEVPKVMGAKGEKMGRRINITFRVFKT